ncbi:hypothetical protein V500_03648 [Pseudogymnoascus sp. VKM F-4518 (FW-2643)]|nr:hypothetical protein V500_03648 [Pseudogymnoascus sp. VKM F-4518 (FW-2643)]
MVRGDHGQSMVRGDHGISLSPLKAGLPWASGILSCRQSKPWRLSLETTRAWLKEFATEDSMGVISKSGNSIAEISQKELASNFEEGWAKFPIYFFPEGDEQRTKLLAATNVFIFLFDDFWEMHDVTSFSQIQEVFVARMQIGKNLPDDPKSTLHSLIDDMTAEILDLDRNNGNDSGREMLDEMVRFFGRPPPPEKYNNMEDFLLYRHEDAAIHIRYVLACTKFSLNSCLDLDSSRLVTYIRLFKDQVSVANDLASWEKEKKAYDAGKVMYMINTVDVVKQLFNLATFDTAVAMTQAFQFQIECDIDDKIQQLVTEDDLTADEWRFIDATLHVMSGNTFTSTVMSRYGGESYRLE